jgi:hypothetical protein
VEEGTTEREREPKSADVKHWNLRPPNQTPDPFLLLCTISKAKAISLPIASRALPLHCILIYSNFH